MDITGMFKVTTVEVVQSIDVELLKKTLGWLVERVQELPKEPAGDVAGASGALQAQVDVLRRDNDDLKALLQQLRDKQDALESRLDATPAKDQDQDQDTTQLTAAAAGAAGPSAAADLEPRVAALEQKLANLPAPMAGGSGSADAAGAGGAGGSDTAGAGATGVDHADALQALQRQLAELGQQLEGLAAGQEALEAAGQRLAAAQEQKANRSELDALLQGGAIGAGSGAAGGETAKAPLAVREDGGLDHDALVDAVNSGAADLAALRGQMAMLADRLGSKADTSALDDLSAQLVALRTQLQTLPRAATPPAGDYAPASELAALLRRLQQLEARAALAAAAPSAAAAAGATPGEDAEAKAQAVDAVGTLADVQPLLKELFARIDTKADRAPLEEALAALQASIDGKADAAALQDLARRLLDSEERRATSASAATGTGAGGAGEALPAGSAGAAAAALRRASGSANGNEPWSISHELPPDGADWGRRFEELRALVEALQQRLHELEAGGLGAAAGGGMPRLRTSVGGDADLSSLQQALSWLQNQMGEMATRLAGKADAAALASLELAINAKADLDELQDARAALAAKADGDTLAALQVAVAGKADVAQLDELRLAAALGAAGGGDASADGGDGAEGGGGGRNAALLAAVQALVGDKATRAELEELQKQLSGKASADDVAALREAVDERAAAAELAVLSQQVANKAEREEVASLDQRMGDVYGELDKLRADLAALVMPPDAAAAPGFAAAHPGGHVGVGASPRGATHGSLDLSALGDASGLQRILAALSREVGSLRDGMDTVAHAANIMAVGLDGRGSFAGGNGGYGDGGAGNNKENRSPRGAYDRLVKLLGSGEYRCKMDAFDPVLLQTMAQKLAGVEATLKSPAMARLSANGGTGSLLGVPDIGLKDLERQVKRLATDMRVIKDQFGSMPAPAAVTGLVGLLGNRMPVGDHAMLAAKPIGGYRCMACDRPLDQLDHNAGPHIPTNLMPVKVAAAPELSARDKARSARPGGDLSPQASSGQLKMTNDPNVRGPQNWYQDAKGAPADQLPREHVGPHLPPGGWRSGVPPPGAPPPPPGKAQAGLPTIQYTKNAGAVGSRASPMRSPQVSEPGGPAQHPPRQAAGTPQGLMEGAPANVTLPAIS